MAHREQRAAQPDPDDQDDPDEPSPLLSATMPIEAYDGSRPTTLPWCRLSTNPDRVTSASSAGTSSLQPVGQPGQRQVDHEVDERDDDEGLDQQAVVVPLNRVLPAEREVGVRDPSESFGRRRGRELPEIPDRLARVVEAGSFTKAAQTLDMSKTTVTQLVQQLEAHLGACAECRGLLRPSDPDVARLDTVWTEVLAQVEAPRVGLVELPSLELTTVTNDAGMYRLVVPANRISGQAINPSQFIGAARHVL